MRLIDADALEKKLQEQRELYIENGMKGAEHLLVHDFLRYVWEAPTIDTVRHGKWEYAEDEVLDDLTFSAWKCSCCGYYAYQPELWHYCPKCGAKMDGDR